MRVAVTGADGFTGRYVLNALAARNVESVALVADLTNPDAVAQEIAHNCFDGLIHLAAIAFVATDDWRQVYGVNQLGTFNLLEAVARHRPGVRCILASSAQIYGPQAEGLITESATPNPANPYAISKYAMELGTKRWRDILSITLVRPFNYTGVGQEDQYLIPKIVRHFKLRQPTIELGNLDVARDFGDVRAAAAAYVALALDSSADVTVNLCSGQVTRLNDVIRMAEDLTGHHIEIAVNPAFVRSDDVKILGGDVSRLRQLLPSWRPISLPQTLHWMLSTD